MYFIPRPALAHKSKMPAVGHVENDVENYMPLTPSKNVVQNTFYLDISALV